LLREGLAGLVSDLLETSERPIALLDPDCHFLYANRAMQARLEVDADRVDRVTVTSLVEADELERVRSEAWPALRRDGVWEGHVSAKASGTEPEIIALTVRAHADGDGRVRYVSVIAEDDPPGVAMTAELVASEARFRAMAERSHDLVALFVDGRFAYASPSHARVIGYQPD